MKNEIHISSVVLYAVPNTVSGLEYEIREYPYSELAFSDRKLGKMVVVLETQSMGQLKQAVSHLEQLDGVLTSSMVYHHVDAPGSLREAIA